MQGLQPKLRWKLERLSRSSAMGCGGRGENFSKAARPAAVIEKDGGVAIQAISDDRAIPRAARPAVEVDRDGGEAVQSILGGGAVPRAATPAAEVGKDVGEAIHAISDGGALQLRLRGVEERLSKLRLRGVGERLSKPLAMVGLGRPHLQGWLGQPLHHPSQLPLQALQP